MLSYLIYRVIRSLRLISGLSAYHRHINVYLQVFVIDSLLSLHWLYAGSFEDEWLYLSSRIHIELMNVHIGNHENRKEANTIRRQIVNIIICQQLNDIHSGSAVLLRDAEL